MERVTPGRPWPLHDVATIRRIEAEAAAALAPHMLMQRAGLAVARLALALAPHARTVWLACGPGNNGGDGLEAAVDLKAWGSQPIVTWLGRDQTAPQDARTALKRARDAGVTFADQPPAQFDLAIDALFGIGARKPLEGMAAQWRQRMAGCPCPVLAVDVPSGLEADTGRGDAVRASHTLTLLALKPGLFTAGGRDAAGEVWFDDLGLLTTLAPIACLSPAPERIGRPHSSHKGSWGDIAVIGGAPGMRGATLLAACGALHGGAGRVYVASLGPDPLTVDTGQPDLMFRDPAELDVRRMHVACGCGGGDAIVEVLPRVISTARSLVLDADGLNALARDPQLQTLLRARGTRDRGTVLTPHPLEAARLLQTDVGEVQADRLGAAQRLADGFGCVVVLKGSGTVIAAPAALRRINPTGNARLAIAGTGDVLTGMIAARLGTGQEPLDAARDAVYSHGLAADRWRTGQPLTAMALARTQAWDFE